MKLKELNSSSVTTMGECTDLQGHKDQLVPNSEQHFLAVFQILLRTKAKHQFLKIFSNLKNTVQKSTVKQSNNSDTEAIW